MEGIYKTLQSPEVRQMTNYYRQYRHSFYYIYRVIPVHFLYFFTPVIELQSSTPLS